MRYWAAGLLLTVLLFGGGWLSSGAAPDVSRSVPGADPGQTGENAGQTAADADTVLRVWDGEQVVEMTMAEYLPGVVRGEMPAAFHQQALDAQAVAERTFIYYHMASGRKAAHPDADVLWFEAAERVLVGHVVAGEQHRCGPGALPERPHSRILALLAEGVLDDVAPGA